MSRRRIILAIFAAPVLLAGWWFSAYPRGMIVAWIDASRGHREIKVFGHPPAEANEYSQLMQRRYVVQVNPVAGCVVSQDLRWYVDGYNSVSVARMNSYFGKDIVSECWKDAETEWKQKHPGLVP